MRVMDAGGSDRAERAAGFGLRALSAHEEQARLLPHDGSGVQWAEWNGARLLLPDPAAAGCEHTGYALCS